MTLKTTDCPKCDGTGKVLDRRAVGSAMRSERERAGVSLRALGTILNVSAAYLSELELGAHPWTEALVEAYMKALATAKQQRGK